MLTRAKLKQYQQLSSKKFRQKYKLFIVEGTKSVNELLTSDWPIENVICTEDYLRNNVTSSKVELRIVSKSDFNSISLLNNPQEILAIAHYHSPDIKESNYKIAVDNLQDPGNLGTIIRIADWYGISSILCSQDSVDLYNSKVIQATMGSFLRVNVEYVNLEKSLQGKNVYATLLNGENIRTIQPKPKGVILIGNEANGIRLSLLEKISHTAVSIPRTGKAESLNAGIATAICCERLAT